MSVDPGRYPYPPQQPSAWVQQPAPQPYAYAPPPPVQVYRPVPGGPGFVNSGGDSSGAAIALAAIGVIVLIGMMAAIAIPSFLNQRAKQQQASGGGGDVQIAADGRSSLPGGHARLTYEPLPGQVEWLRETSVDAPYDGSLWWLGDSNSEDQMMIQYYTYQPPIDNAQALERAVAGVQNQAANEAADPVVFKSIDVGESEGYRFRYRNRPGREVLRVWIFGPVHSYQLECSVASPDSPMLAQCERAIKTLRVDA